MALDEAMRALGVTRIVWIDDLFADRPMDLVELLLGSPEVAESVPAVAEIFEGFEFDPEGTQRRLAQFIADMDIEERHALQSRFFVAEANQPELKTPELSREIVDRACDILQVSEGDRCSFDDAPDKLAELVAGGDGHVGYVIDLNESGGLENRGLEIIELLWRSSSKGVPFLLTHAAEEANEATKEMELRGEIIQTGDTELGVPLAVIAKERLPTNVDDRERIQAAFETGLKRAGLRRAVHCVLASAQNEISCAYSDAANDILKINPEQLDSYVMERGRAEGVSELHVIERALSARTSQRLRKHFASDDAVVSNLRMIRELRSIPLGAAAKPSKELVDFRKAEVWDADEIVNASLSPLACGDVFEVDTTEDETRTVNRKFVLLGQPCDIALRGDGKRTQTGGLLVPIKTVPDGTAGTPKAPLVPFELDDMRWRFDFREACVARLSVLDLASFRKDGKVSVDVDHTPSADLLPGLAKVYSSRTAPAAAVLAGANQEVVPPLANQDLTLLLSEHSVFRHIRDGVFKPAANRDASGALVSRPERVTWHLRRIGRIRMPYAASILEQFLSDFGRRAFDMEF